MALFLQIILAVVLVVLCACLVPLLLQLRRTAASIQNLAESARGDLNEIAKDLHQVRTRVDELADLAADTMAFPATLGQWLTRLTARLSEPQEPKGSGWMGIALAGVKVALNAFMRPKEKHHE